MPRRKKTVTMEKFFVLAGKDLQFCCAVEVPAGDSDALKKAVTDVVLNRFLGGNIYVTKSVLGAAPALDFAEALPSGESQAGRSADPSKSSKQSPPRGRARSSGGRRKKEKKEEEKKEEEKKEKDKILTRRAI